jgi:hypothetical protein
MKGIVLALFFISGCVVGVDGALAQCACSHPNITALEEFKKSEAVFIGEVLSSDIVENPAHKTRGDVYDMEIKFKVTFLIQSSPTLTNSFAGVHPTYFGFHRMLSKRFPFGIYYEVEDDVIYVYAILDLRRDPIWIRKRLLDRR